MLRILALLALLPGLGLAQSIDGNAVHAACQSQEQDVRIGFCIGYIGGVWDGIKLGSSTVLIAAMEDQTIEEIDNASNTLLSVCMPPNVEQGQIIDVFSQYLDRNPAIRHESARSLLLLSLQEAFPCA
jgi:hypothetical protein